MPRKPESRGNCAWCGAELTKHSIPKHLETCPKWQDARKKKRPAH